MTHTLVEQWENAEFICPKTNTALKSMGTVVWLKSSSLDILYICTPFITPSPNVECYSIVVGSTFEESTELLLSMLVPVTRENSKAKAMNPLTEHVFALTRFRVQNDTHVRFKLKQAEVTDRVYLETWFTLRSHPYFLK